MATASAPGKAFLFGEHAVVYGEPALLCAIDRRATATVERRDGTGATEVDRVEAPDLGDGGVEIRYDSGDEPGAGTATVEAGDGDAAEGLGYVTTALDRVRAAVGSEARFIVEVSSDLPVGAGLGSSAAVTVATVRAALAALDTDAAPEEIAAMGHDVERGVQGAASPADTYASSVGGAVWVVPDEELRRLDADLRLAVAHDGTSASTAAMVEGVRRFREATTTGERVVATIGALAREGRAALQDGDDATVGRLMDANHGLLSALGVSTAGLDELVWAARDAGADGAKLTGAGGGGSVVALPGSEAVADGLHDVAASVHVGGLAEGVRLE